MTIKVKIYEEIKDIWELSNAKRKKVQIIDGKAYLID